MFKKKSWEDKIAYALQTTTLNHRDYEHDSHRGSIVSNIEAQYDLNSIQLSLNPKSGQLHGFFYITQPNLETCHFYLINNQVLTYNI